MRSLRSWRDIASRLRLPNYLPAVVSAVLAAAILMRAAGIAVMWWRGGVPAIVVADSGLTAAVQAAQARRADEKQQLPQLLASHLFGDAPDPRTSAVPVPVSAGWVLSGTLQGPTPASGSAIVGQGRESTRFHIAGQDVLPGYRLAQVFSDRVTIEHAGQLMSVRLPRDRLALPSTGATVVAAATTEPAPRAPPQKLRGPPPNRPFAMTVLKPTPYLSADGHYAGMRIWGANGSALLQLGLKQKDVITRVSGRPIDSTEAARQALIELSKGEAVKVTVERNGAPEDISLTFVDNKG